MRQLKLDSISAVAAKRISPFLGDIVAAWPDALHSIHITGSACTADFDDRASDINSLIVLKESDFEFIKFLAPLGKKYSSSGTAAPLVMTAQYIAESLDVFPMEFLDMQLVHKTVYGNDLLSVLVIEREHLRLQCEREAKVRLLSIRQKYISAMGDADKLGQILYRSAISCLPLFRSLVYMNGTEPPITKTETLKAFAASTGIALQPFMQAIGLKDRKIKNNKELLSLYEEYCKSLESVSDLLNGLE